MTLAREGAPVPEDADAPADAADDDRTVALATELLSEVMVEIDRADQKA